jgi:hypothetical protein
MLRHVRLFYVLIGSLCLLAACGTGAKPDGTGRAQLSLHVQDMAERLDLT